MFLLDKKRFSIRKTKDKGRGVFARDPIRAGEVIGDYLGVVLRDKELDSKEGLYGFWRSEGETIWPDLSKVGVHLLNHSCMPNCGVRPYKGHVLFFAARAIFPDEELTISYFIAPPSAEDEDTSYPRICRCGTRLCGGSMYATDDFLVRYYEHFFSGAEADYLRPLVPFGRDLPPLARYPASVRDVPIYGVFAAPGRRPLRYDDERLPPVRTVRDRIRTTGRPVGIPSVGAVAWGVRDKTLFVDRTA